jgi:hypothetical protein
MPNGKPGDNPYDDIINHGQEFEMAEAAALVRALHKLDDPELQHLVFEIVCFLTPSEKSRYPDYQRKTLTKHLRTIRRLIESESRAVGST